MLEMLRHSMHPESPDPVIMAQGDLFTTLKSTTRGPPAVYSREVSISSGVVFVR